MRAPHSHPNPIPRNRPRPTLRSQNPTLTAHEISLHVWSPGIWCAIVALAVEVTAWMQMLALNGHAARRWEKRLRLRLFTIPATIARTGRRVLLHLAAKAPWADLLDTAVQRLRALTAAPG